MRVPVAPHSHQYLIWSVFFILAIIVGMQWHFIVILICISLRTNDIEHFKNVLICHLYIFSSFLPFFPSFFLSFFLPFFHFWLCLVLAVAHGIFVAAHELFVVVRGLLSLVAARGLSSCSARAQQLWHTGSLVVTRRLSCPSACGILVPRPGMEPPPPAL